MGKTLKNIVFNIDAIVTGAAIIGMTGLVIANVFMRYFLNMPFTWSEEVATTFFVWSIFIGGEVTFRKRAHLGVDVLVKIMPEKLKKFVNLINGVITTAILSILTYTSVIYMLASMNKKSNVLLFSVLWYTVPVVIGFGVSLIWSIIFMVRDFTVKPKEGE